MELLFIVFGVLSGLELMVWLPPVWRRRRPLSVVILAALAMASLAIVVIEPGLWTGLLALLSLYRMLNLLRLAKGRIQADYLYHSSRRAAVWLVALQGADLASARLANYYQVSLMEGFYILAAAQLAAGLVLLATVRRHLRTTKPVKLTRSYADHELPSLTVAIPARNETADLEDCLQSLTASDYPKLEILVLDDCSQNKRTPEIIRGFAHDGVRFVAGIEPPGQWLAKNYAYAQLAEEANGDLLLFCGVDVRFSPSSLRSIVETALEKKKSMVSIIPKNALPGRRSIKPVLLQPARYAWELGLPRRLLRRPPVLSSCWLISRETLQTAGGFAAVKRKAIPESYFARQAAGSQDGYSFMRSDTAIGITSRKETAEQLATTVRTRYPQLHRRPELVALVSLAEFSVLAAPLILAAGAVASRHWLLAVLSAAAYAVGAAGYGEVVSLTYRKFLVRSLWLFPMAAIYDIGILNYSMWQYEFREVIWKGRNICIPVMRVVPDLPKLN